MFFVNLQGKFLKDERGGILVLVAVAMVVLLGISALAVDAGDLYQTRRQMVNAADAAALAGAQEFYYDSNWGNVKTYAENYAINNYGCDPDLVFAEQVGNNGVKVTTGKNVEHVFARFLNFTDTDVHATATAVFAKIIEGNIIPIGMTESFFNSLPLDTDEDFVYFDNNHFGSGNWSWVYFDKNENAETTVEILESGVDASVDDPIWSNTGANIPVGNRAEDVARILQDYIDNKTILYVPIIKDIVDMPTAGKKESVIIGFAAVQLTSFDISNPKDQRISGNIIGIIDAGEAEGDGSGDRLMYSGVTLID